MNKVVQRYTDGETLEIRFSNYYMAKCYWDRLVATFKTSRVREHRNYATFQKNNADLMSARIV